MGKARVRREGDALLNLLPQELVVEILCRLTADSIMEMRCVCKSWKSLISDPQLLKPFIKRCGTEIEARTRAVMEVVRSILSRFSYANRNRSGADLLTLASEFRSIRDNLHCHLQIAMKEEEAGTQRPMMNATNPHPGAVIVQMDAATKENNGTGVSIIIMDQDNNFLAAANSMLQNAQEPRIAEALCLRWLMVTLLELGITHALLKIDCLQILHSWKR
ncbi:hypothetical protein RIF29_08149 [Crotalaria pallida]|uniref:F-box domain-containing protein n=1 Tax=Crotalaria pallida TaxID=3830 RepID=A0AAN9PBS7_CROPI